MAKNGYAPRLLIDRILEKYIPEPNSGCWLWLASINRGGYAMINSGGHDGHPLLAHRVIYEHFIGPIPDGLEPDHKCRVRCCINPWHLEPVTRRENIMRGIGPELLRARNAAKTSCPKGHPYSEENLYVTPAGRRSCRQCRREAGRAYDRAHPNRGRRAI